MQPDYLIIYGETNDAAPNTAKKIAENSLMPKSNISKQIPIFRIALLKLIIWHDDGKAKLLIHHVNKHLSALQSAWIENNNIRSQHLRRKKFHLHPKCKESLALNFLKQIGKLWRSIEHVNESFLLLNLSHKIDHIALRKSDNLLSKPIIGENTYDVSKLKQLRNENPCRVFVFHIDTHSIRKKIETLVKYVGNNLDRLMVSETKIDDTFSESKS